MTIHTKLKLHKNQLKVFMSGTPIKVIVAGRGFGKSWLMLITAIHFCLDYSEPIQPESPQVAMIAMPTLKMAKAIFWRPLLSLLEHHPMVAKVDKTDYRFTFVGERPDLVLRGADLEGERLRGLNLCFAGLDEYQGFSPIVWEEILDPALSRNANFQALVIGTPKGKLNHFYSFHEKAIANSGWHYWHFTTKDNPYFPLKHLRRAYNELPGRTYRQEFKASFEEFEGQIATEAYRERHLLRVSPRPTEQYYIAIDPGVINPAIVLFGVGSSDYLFTVYDTFYKNTGTPYTTDDLLRLTTEMIGKFGRTVRRIYIPDDRADLVRTFRQGGLSTAVLTKRNDPGPLQRAEIMNTLFKCDRLIISDAFPDFWDELLSYHRDTDKEGKVIEAIAPGQCDHRIDALLYGVCRLAMDYPILLPVPDKLLPETKAA